MEALGYFALGAAVVALLAFVKMRVFDFPAQKPKDYLGDTGTTFDLQQHLDGDLICEGVIYGPMGRVVSRFRGDFKVSWSGDNAIMSEHFYYESGEEQLREWQLTLDADGAIRATADDVVGEGRGKQSGSSVQMRYRLKLPEDAGGVVLSATDWMYLVPGGTIVNRSQFRKFGVKLVELVATIRPKEAA